MKNIVVVDLDGCLFTVNTFRFWLLFSSLYLFFSLRWLSLSKFIRCIFFRVFGSNDRVQMKRCVLEVTEELAPKAIDKFCKFLKIFVNSDVLSELAKYKGMTIVLSTAAPIVYVDALVREYNFTKVFATLSVHEPNWKENIGVTKLENLTSFFGADVVLRCVITDHHDDLPILLRAEKRTLVRPSVATLAKVADAFEYEVI